MGGVLGILLSLALLMYLAYRGVNVIVLSPLLALLAVLMDGTAPLLASYTQVFMAAMGKFTVKYFPIFLLGAIFGKLMEDSGSARTIALAITRRLGSRHAILAVVLACAVLTYGGVSLFVVAFAVYPLAAAVFREADVPKRLIPAAIALGAFTLTMTCLPGTVQIQNLIPMPYFKTTAFAAPVLGTAGGLVMLALGMVWLNGRARRAALAGEGYGTGHVNEAPVFDGKIPSLPVACLPIVAVIALNYALAEQIIPRWQAAYLADPKFGSTQLSDVKGIWAILTSLAASIGLVMALNFRSLSAVNDAVGKGAAGSLAPMFNTASVVGFGATVASLSAFAAVKTWVLGISPGNPLVSAAVAITILAGITGSASGGMSIALETLGETYYRLAMDSGINPELMHRVVSMASGGLDTLPHNGAVITLLAICGLTHKQSYADVAVVSVLVPIVATAVVVAIATLLGSF